MLQTQKVDNVHVTRVDRLTGDVYGHTTEHCDANGCCNAFQRYFLNLSGSMFDGDGGCVAGDIVPEVVG
jgi:hypothetical protein